MTTHRAFQIGFHWYCCELIPGGDPHNQSHWDPGPIVVSEEAARSLSRTKNGNEDLLFDPAGSTPTTPAYKDQVS